MNGHVFQCYEECTDRRQFEKTKEALAAYIYKTVDFPDDLESIFAKDMTEPVLEKPVELEEGYTTVDKAIWDQELKEFVKKKGYFQG